MQHDGRGSHGLLNVVTQDTALKGRAKRPFLICANLRHRTVGVFKPRSPCQDSEAAEVPLGVKSAKAGTAATGMSSTQEVGSDMTDGWITTKMKSTYTYSSNVVGPISR